MSDSDQPIVMVLERIAVALERLAGITTAEHPTTAEFCTKTDFPWHEMSTRTINSAQHFNPPKGYEFPYSCEDLVAIGRERFYEARNLGDKSIDEIAVELDRRGFPQWNPRAKKPRKFLSPMVVFASIPADRTQGASANDSMCEAATHIPNHRDGDIWRQCSMPVTCGNLCRSHFEMEKQNGRVSFDELESP